MLISKMHHHVGFWKIGSYFATIYLMYPLLVKECTKLHKRTTEHTLHSRVNLSITQNIDCCFPKNAESQSQ